MAYTTPTTRTTGELITAAIWNQDLVDNISFLANPPACRVYKTGTQSLTNGADATFTFDAERFDTDGMHSTTVNTDRITINTAGLYVVGGWMSTASDTDFQMYRLILQANGTTNVATATATHTYSGSIGAHLNVSAVWKFVAADVVRLIGMQVNGSGGANNTTAEFWATWVGRG